jgi:hypothetical protein
MLIGFHEKLRKFIKMLTFTNMRSAGSEGLIAILSQRIAGDRGLILLSGLSPATPAFSAI